MNRIRMTKLWARVKFALDLFRIALFHPRWCVGVLATQAKELRSNGMARFEHGLHEKYHHHLDPRIKRLAVEVGGAHFVELSKALIVARFCRLLNPRRVLEIGTFRGGMTSHIARNTSDDCQIFTLDVPRTELGGIAKQMIPSDAVLASMDENLVGSEWVGAPYAHRITQLWGDSMTFDFADLAPFDLIYIDGSHAEPWVQRDTENAFRFLSSTAAILWDDCRWREVQIVLGRFAKLHPIYLFEDQHTAGYLRVDGCDVRTPS